MRYVLSHSAEFIAILAAICAPGVVWSRILFRPGPDRLVACVVTGFATWMAVAFGLCLTHLLTRPVVASLAVLFVLVAMRGWTRPVVRLNWMHATIWIPIGIVLCAIYLIALSPLPGWDAGHYHLTIPRLYVEAGGFRAIPFSVQSNWPMNGELLYALALLFVDHVSAGLLHFAFGLATSVLLIAGAMKSGVRNPGWAGAIAVALFWSSPIVQYDATVANDDLAVTFFFLATGLATWFAMETSEVRKSWIVLAGISAGMLAGTKVSGALAVAPVVLVAVLRLVREPAARSSKWITHALLPAFALAVVWPIKSWAMTGNPAYPFLFDRFGGPDWSQALSERFRTQMLALGMGRSVVDYVLLAFRVILFGDNDFAHFDGKVGVAWIVIVPVVIIFGWRSRFVRSTLAVSGLFFVIWAAGSQQVRYLIPALGPLSLAAGIAVVIGIERVRERSLAWAGVAASLLLLANSRPACVGAWDWTRNYARRGDRLPDSAIPSVYKYINAELPPDARVLLINTNQTYFIHREFIADSFFLASQVADWLSDAPNSDAVWAKLRDAHVTHLLVGKVSGGTTYPNPVSDFVNGQQGMRLIQLYSSDGLDLDEICGTVTCGRR